MKGCLGHLHKAHTGSAADHLRNVVNLKLQLSTGCSGEQIAFTADAPDLSGMALCCQMLSPQFCLFNTNMKSTVSFEAKIDGSGEDRVQKV